MSEHAIPVKQSQLISHFNCMLGIGSILVEMVACYHHIFNVDYKLHIHRMIVEVNELT